MKQCNSMLACLKPHLAGALVALLTVSACGRLSGKESDLSYEQATDRIIEIAERSIEVALGDQLNLAEKRLSQRTCDDVFGGPSDYVYPVVDYQFPMKLLEEDSDSFVDEVEKLWNANGLESTGADSSKVTKRFGVSSDGFNYQVTVNRESEIVYVGGSGPCVDPPDE